METFKTMRSQTELRGDFRTFTVLIAACAHSGDVERARKIWEQIEDAAVKYHRNVITTIVDCYARGGMLSEGYDVLKEYHGFNGNVYDPEDVTIMMALLSGCTKSG